MDQTIKRKRKNVRFAAVTLFAVLAFAPAVRAQQPPEPPAGFVPADSVKPQEQLPAAPLVLGAYAVAWVGVFGYLWSIWSRLGRVERDIADVNRRLAADQRR
jgi:CcmD family protein